MQKTDVTDLNWWANLIGGLLEKGEWQTLLFTLVISFAATYIMKILYFSFIQNHPFGAYHIRLIAITAGFIAAWLMWKEDAISMKWYTAGIMIGPLSIVIHHIIEGISKMAIVKKWAPWLYPLIKGQPDKRKKRR